jgi:predicted dienelactone hydrolase
MPKRLALATVAFLVVPGCGNDGRQLMDNPACASCSAAYNAGFQELTFTDTERGRTLNTAIWYPTTAGAPGSTQEFAGGPPDPSGGPYPLILSSHGACAYARGTSFMAREWARRGFVVAAPDHEKDTWGNCDLDARAMMQFARPLDMSFVLDQMLLLDGDVGSFLYGLVDPQSIGMSGGSFGGHTTLILAGATPNLDHLADYCTSDPACDWDICCMQGEIQQLYPGQRIIDLSDPRITAALPMVADGYGWLREDGMAKIKIPILFMGGQNDTIAPPATQQIPMYAATLSTKYLLIMSGAEHATYADGCGGRDIDLLATCAAYHSEIVLASTAFWMRHLNKDERCGAALETCAPTMPHVGTFNMAAN